MCTCWVTAWHHQNDCVPSSLLHYSDVIMCTMASQITSFTVVYSAVFSGEDKHQSSALLAFVRGIHRWPVNSPHKGPVTRKMFPFDDVIMKTWHDVMITSSWHRGDIGVPFYVILTHKQLETHGCVFNTVTTAALVLKHQATVLKIFVISIRPVSYKTITFTVGTIKM